MVLFGFLTKEELELFKRLITVTGIGPKGALAILSTLSVDDLRFAILSGTPRPSRRLRASASRRLRGSFST